jgi:hypothetical protein
MNHDRDAFIAAEGLRFDKEASKKQDPLFAKWRGSNGFHVSILQSLIWSGHARESPQYFEVGMEILTGKTKHLTPDLRTYATPRGKQMLGLAITSWNKILESIGPIDITKGRIEDILIYQDECQNMARPLKEEKEIKGVGPWIFCAPFKILLTHRNDLWKDPRADEVLMPLGSEVIKALELLRDENHPDFMPTKNRTLSTRDPGFFKGRGLTHVVQECCKRFADRMNTRVMQINSGLYCLGRSSAGRD